MRLTRELEHEVFRLAHRIEREIFDLANQLALQADLHAAMRVLHDGLSRLTYSPDTMCVFFDAALCSAWAIPGGEAGSSFDDTVRHLIAQVVGTGRRAALERVIVEPLGAAPVRAVLVIRRPPTSPAYGGFEIAIITAVATAVAGIVSYFAADHAIRRAQQLRDARSAFRSEALAARSGALAAPGRCVAPPQTSRRCADAALIVLFGAALVATAIIVMLT